MTARNIVIEDGFECRRWNGRSYLTYEQAASYCGVRIETIRNWASAGKIESRLVGRVGHTPKDSLDDKLAEGDRS